ncbi:DUF2207 domain-containing protein [Planococcus sp. N064]|uniref:DUF2207 domain-containing protein n=1 Tax=Planococcus liqunii TaxID=3058394 RepID=A0ABT8MT55_9BACL|nr:DUF2207 domain-containing protein [Planococcus sp. N064]MDN7228097.1 DUF2207 domain-containing protein [Planococcus sp. N064]
MERKMLAFFSFFLLLVPAEVFAVDFGINNADIQAELDREGNAFVTERYTYEFDGDFNGITRQIKPKAGTAVTGFSASEGAKKLEVEQYGDLYKIHRTGGDETITIQLSYTISNAVEKFEDGAQFFWPFFDDRNVKTYQDLDITVSPPAAAQEVEYLGYEEAYGTALLSKDGSVTFTLGDVTAGANGDIRVIYAPELFPAADLKPGAVKNDLINDRNRLAIQQAAFEKNQQTANIVGLAALPVAAFMIAFLFGLAFRKRRRALQDFNAQDTGAFVPDDELSIPAAIYFTKSPFLGPNALAAALVELVRKGLVQQHSEDQYELVSRKTELLHELTLIKLLFEQIGDGTQFQLSDIETYTKNKTNHIPYNDSLSDWNEQVAQEVRQKNLYENHSGIRWLSVGLCTAFAALAFYTARYDLYMEMAFFGFSALAALLFAVFYMPLAARGRRIKAQWKRLGKALKKMPAEHWEQLSQNEWMRVYAFNLGCETTPINRPSAVLALSDNRANQLDQDGFYLNTLLLTGIFMAASSNTIAEADGSTFADGGVGDAGGGSGAF